MTHAIEPYELAIVGSAAAQSSCEKPVPLDRLREVFHTVSSWQPKRIDEPFYSAEVRQIDPKRDIEPLDKDHREWIARIHKKELEGAPIVRHGTTREGAIQEVYRKLDEGYQRLSSTIPVRLMDSEEQSLKWLQQLIDVVRHQANKRTSIQGKARVVDRDTRGLRLAWYIEDEKFLVPTSLLKLGEWGSCQVGDWVQVAVTQRRGSGEVINAMMLGIIPEPTPMSSDELEC